MLPKTVGVLKPNGRLLDVAGEKISIEHMIFWRGKESRGEVSIVDKLDKKVLKKEKAVENGNPV